MKRTYPTNIDGQIFYIDDDAFELLQNYLKQLKITFSGTEGEEIVGDIDDEYDEEEESIEKLDEDDYLVDGNTDLDDLNEALGTDLESDRSETIGGYLIDMIGEIPRDGYVNQAVSFERYTFTILSVRERRIEKVRLHIDRNYSPQDEDEKTREEKEEQKS